MSMTLDGTTGIVLPTNAAPTFSAYASATLSLSANTVTKIQCNTKEFDTNSNYDNATNYRFTPTVAGYYLVNVCFQTTSAVQAVNAYIYKNGSLAKVGTQSGTGGLYMNSGQVSALIQMNGTTDYVEFYALTGAASTVNNGATQTYFQASMVRST